MTRRAEARRGRGLAALAVITGLGLAVAGEATAKRPGGGSSFSGDRDRGSSFGGGGGGGGGGGVSYDDDDDAHGSSFGSSSSSRSSSSSSFGSSSSNKASYGSSSSSHGSSSRPVGQSDDDFGFLFLLAIVVFAYKPARTAISQRLRSTDAWASVFGGSKPPDDDSVEPVALPSLEHLRAYDPNFSQILLEDFLYELYIRAHEARASQEDLALLAPYLAGSVRERLASRRRPLAVSGVIVGSMQVINVEQRGDLAAIDVQYETNYTETYPSQSGKGQLGFYAKERWTFVRRLSVPSRKPDETRSFGCASCGAPVEQSEADACRFCGVKHGTGDFDWVCSDIHLEREETRGPALGGYAPEVGTQDPTVRNASVDDDLAELQRIDSSFDRERFLARVDMIYHRLNEAWSSLRWEDARPYLSDRLWLSMRYWIHAYEEQGLHNQMQRAEIERTVIAKLARDPFFHAITVRLWASAIDVTVHRQTRAVVGGDVLTPRKYSEYWTFIRSAARRGPASTDAQCPSCSAPLSINMAGSCDRCGVKLTAGQFDWVLSKIEQDEAYRG